MKECFTKLHSDFGQEGAETFIDGEFQPHPPKKPEDLVRTGIEALMKEYPDVFGYEEETEFSEEASTSESSAALSTPRQLECFDCSKKYSNRNRLARHYAAVHEGKKVRAKGDLE